MLAPLIARETFVWKNAFDSIERNSGWRGRPVAVARKAALILRPQSMDDEPEIGAGVALLVALVIGVQRAKSGGPGQRQHVEVEVAAIPAAPEPCLGRALLLGLFAIGAAIEDAVVVFRQRRSHKRMQRRDSEQRYPQLRRKSDQRRFLTKTQGPTILQRGE